MAGLLLKGEIVLFFFMAFCGLSKGFVYKVGDSAGWTIRENVDYNAWAASKLFQVGDTLIFEYEPQYHNVMQVSRSDFHRCNGTAPIATFSTGNDTVLIRGPGHYYYICGFVGHCQAGQKVDIRVPKGPLRPSAIPISSPIPAQHEPAVQEASPIGPMAPGPSQSSSESLKYSKIGLLLTLVFMGFN